MLSVMMMIYVSNTHTYRLSALIDYAFSFATSTSTCKTFDNFDLDSHNLFYDFDSKHRQGGGGGGVKKSCLSSSTRRRKLNYELTFLAIFLIQIF